MSVPVTILTGFLGSGKTTLLNRILREHHGQRIAVIENEFGEVGIDQELLFRGGDEELIVTMSNGCVCCTVRGDLVRMLEELRAKRASGAIAFDRVIIETTGLADPGPVAHTFSRHGSVAAHYRLDAIVTVVDARHAQRQLDEFHEAQEQVGFADRILLSKTDLVTPGEEERLRARLVAMNPRAPVSRVHFGETAIADILDIRFDANAFFALRPEPRERLRRHVDRIGSFVFRASQPFDPARLDAFLSSMADVYGSDLLRYKGVLYFNGQPHRVILQGVQALIEIETGPLWLRDEEPASVLVFIGRDLPREVFTAGLTHCLASTVTETA